MDCTGFVGRCLGIFLVAIFLDAVGLVLLFIGIFAPVNFGDFLVFTGSLLIFVSQGLWILWYLGNIEVPLEELIPVKPAVEAVVTFGAASLKPAAGHSHLLQKEFWTEL
uniref:Transmembrane protein 238-like n=1 Tax=Gadus morhua TaxID=8049 RepID=A0A8C5BJP2_GADMO